MKEKKKNKKNNSLLYSTVLPLVELVVIVFVIRYYVLEAYQVPTGSMIETILPGDFLLVEKITYKFSDPKPGEIIVFKYPKEPAVKYVKRCIAVAGDTVEVRDKALFVNGLEVIYEKAHNDDQEIYPAPQKAPKNIDDYTNIWQQRRLDEIFRLFVRDNFGPVVVPPNSVFAMGDNRDYSLDSRYWGPVPLDHVTGRPTFIYLSTDVIDDISLEERRQFSMLDNIILMVKSIIKFWRIRYDRIFMIIK